MTTATAEDRLVWADHRSIAMHPELPGVEVFLIKVGPEQAAEMLKRNTDGQRTISKISVEKLATDMATMEWMFNGAPLLFGSDGKLYDGQHRLTAIVDSGEEQVLLIVTGIDPNAMDTIDTNRRRSYADTLKMKGISNHPIVAALAGRSWYWFHGNYGDRGIARVADPKYLSATPSNAQKNFWMEHVEKAYDITFEQAAAFGAQAYQARPGVSSGTYALAWVVLSGIDKDLREKFFFELLKESASTASGYPIVAFTNRLLRLKSRERLTRVDQLDAIWTTYNGWLNGRTIRTLTPPRPVNFSTVEIPDGFVELEIKN